MFEMRKIKILCMAFAAIIAAACQNTDQPVVKFKDKIILPKPFRTHDKIEVKPGLTFDILNWGRGADSLSSVLILRSDTIKNSSTAYNFETEGKYIETFNTDMDTDGNPELIIYTTSNKKYSPANVYCFEYSGEDPSKIRFPDLTDKTKKQYKGKDKFYIYQGKLRREFELFDNMEDDKAKPIGKKVVEYSLRGNNLDLTEIEQKK